MKDNLSLIMEDRHGNHVKLNCFFIASDFLPSWQEVKGNHIWESLANLARLFRWECVPSWDTFIRARIRNSRQLVGDFLTAHGKVGPSWPNFYRHQPRQLPDKLSWSWGSEKMANFCSSWTEVNGDQVDHHFTVVGNQLLAIMTRSYLWPWWSPFPAMPCGQVGHK